MTTQRRGYEHTPRNGILLFEAEYHVVYNSVTPKEKTPPLLKTWRHPHVSLRHVFFS